MLLYVLIGIGSFLALVILIALIMPKEYSLSSEVVINKSQPEVFDFVVHLKNQKYFSKWVMMDPNVNQTFTGEDGTVGFIAAWKSENKNVGVGAQEITKIIPGERYEVELRFEKPFKATNHANTQVQKVSESSSKVITTFEARTPAPMNLMVPMIKKMLQRDMDENAATLKRYLESN